MGASSLAHACRGGVVGWGACAPSIMASSFALAAFAQGCQAGSVESSPLACVLCSSWVPLALRCRALGLLSLMTSGGSSLRSRASFLG